MSEPVREAETIRAAQKLGEELFRQMKHMDVPRRWTQGDLDTLESLLNTADSLVADRDRLAGENERLQIALRAADVQTSAIHDKLYNLYASWPETNSDAPDLAVNAEIWKAHTILRAALSEGTPDG